MKSAFVMKHWLMGLALGLTAVGTSLAAYEAKVDIFSPKDGARLDAMERESINYEVTPGPKGDHVHLYVDGDEIAVIRQLKGRYYLDSLSTGKREICIKVVNRAHVLIGVERCVTVKVE